MNLGVAMETVVVAGAAGISALALLARHDRRVTRARRELILEPIRGAFEDATFATDGAGIPRMEGIYGARRLLIELIPDTMTIRRLPQLWVSATMRMPLIPANAGLAILVRPSGADFYSLTEVMGEPFDPPPSFPWECLVRGQSSASCDTLARLTPTVAHILADAKVKEVAVTNRGARIVYQLAEGLRGQHLLLRQCDFDEARLELPLLDRLVGDLDQIATTLKPPCGPSS